MVGDLGVAAIDEEVAAFVDGGLDEARDAVAVLGGDHAAEFGFFGKMGGADFESGGGIDDGGDESARKLRPR